MKTQYFGSDLTFDDYEMLALARIAETHRQIEPELFKTKWFDYRHLHPVNATYLYAASYADAVRNCYSQTKDKFSVEEIVPFSPEDAFNSRELIGFWLSRQAFDSIGVRYEFGLRFAMTRFSNRGWHMFPRPNQLGSEELIKDIQDAWNIECGHTLQIAKHERFKLENYRGEYDQVEYQKFLLNQASKRPHPYRAVCMLRTQNVVSDAVIESVLGAETLRKAIRLMT